MFYEYALEPSVLSDWQSVRYFLDAFGPSKGRFLAKYPKRWMKMVYEALDCPDKEKKKIQLRMAALDPRAFRKRPGSPYDGEKDWLDNALIEHEREPFRAIITVEVHDSEHVLEASSLDETDPLWSHESGSLVARNANAFVDATALLLRVSRKVVLIDPYFRPDQAEKLQAAVALCAAADQPPEGFHIHTTDTLSYAELKRQVERVLPDALPAGVEVTVYCWSEREGGSRLHNRYILTDVGGVQFGDSIESGAQGHHDRISIVGENDRERLLNELYGSEPAFDASGACIDIKGRRQL